jgi:alkylation response protein AidB-like acyl-CoA dehydrogenase
MAQVIADRRDVDFVLHEQFQVGDLSKHERFAEFNKKIVDMVITEARNLAVKEILPTLKIGDEVGCTYANNEVTTPDEFKRVWELMMEGEWMALSQDPDVGGQGMPATLAQAATSYFTGGNMALMLCIALTQGAARLVEAFGTEEQISTYLKNMYTGKWTGTMLLTEADAGSDLGALTTSALKNPDGSYSITGNKIFISSGEHDLTENIIHPVLARIEGAPEGSRGISLFLVPKFFVSEDGSLGERNDVYCTGIEEKMGIHGSPTCSMALGSKGNCIGWLLGNENKGLSQMFLMMNEERQMAGGQGLACASSSYLHALEFARTRIQSAAVGTKDKKPVAIIEHPDVRRMLLTQKMYVEGMRSLLLYVSNCEDKALLADNVEEKEKFENLVDVLIPIAKGYVTDRAVDVCNLGIQVFGGYGYTSDYPVEQLLRDVRICGIYEGTNGIQAMDLLGRKLSMKNGRLFTDLMDEIKKTVTTAKEIDSLEDLAEKVEVATDKMGEVALDIGKTAMSPDVQKAFAHACPFMDVVGDVTMAWMLLWRATLASAKLEKGAKKKDKPFYEGQLKSAEFFIRSVLPVTLGRMASITDSCGAAVEIDADAFGGK